MLKDQILASLKNKYKNLGLSEQVLEGIADMLAVTTTEESQIETAVAGVEKLFKGFQSHTDNRVTEAVKTAKAEAEKPKPAGGNPEPDAPKPTYAPADTITKAIQEAMKPLMDKVVALESGKVTDTRKQQLEAKLKDANQVFASTILEGFEHRTFENDEAFTTYLQGVETKLGEFDKSVTDSNLGALGRPARAGGSNAEASKEEVADIVNQIM